MNFRGLKLNKRTKITCLVLLAVDLLLVFLIRYRMVRHLAILFMLMIGGITLAKKETLLL